MNNEVAKSIGEAIRDMPPMSAHEFHIALLDLVLSIQAPVDADAHIRLCQYREWLLRPHQSDVL